MMAENKPTACGNCALWRKIENPGGPVEIGAEARGTCHALPPTPIMRLHPQTGQPLGQGHARPMPLESETCSLYVDRAAVLNG